MQISLAERKLCFDKKHYVRPKMAYRKWNLAKTNHQTVYIYAMSGYGKSSFIHHETMNNNTIYVSANTVEAADLDIPVQHSYKTVVIDDLQFLRENPDFDECKRQIEQLSRREDIWLILSSRSAISAWLMNTYLNDVFTIINEECLSLTIKDYETNLANWGVTLTSENLKDCYERGCHYGLAARIFGINLSKGENYNDELIKQIEREIWEYGCHHVYEQWDSELRDTVAKLSILDTFNEELACIVMGRSDMEQMFLKMKENGNFLEIEKEESGKDGIDTWYSLRPFVKNSMFIWLKSQYNKERIDKLYYSGGLYYEMKDEPAKAMEFYEKSGDMEQMASVLSKNSRKNPGSGYYFELRKYYLSLPEEIVLKSPELMNGLCMLQSLLLNSDKSEYWYAALKDYAKKHSGVDKKQAESYLMTLDITLPHRGSVDMVRLLTNMGTLISNRKAILPELSVTSNLPSQMNGGKDFSEWSKKDRKLAESIGKLLSIALGSYGRALVNLALAESFFEKGEDSFEISSKLANGRMEADSVDNMEQIFVADGLLSWLYIMTGKPGEAREIMKAFLEKAKYFHAVKLIPNIETFLIRIGLYKGEVVMANEWLKEAPNENMEFVTYDRFHYLTKVRIYLLNGRNEMAMVLLQKLLYYAEVMKRTYIKIECKLLIAIAQYRMGVEQWKDALMECLKGAEEYHFVRLISREGIAVKPLLDRIEYEPENADFYKQVQKEVNEMAKGYPGYLRTGEETITLSDNALIILKLQAEGLSITEIAKHMGITTDTVKYHNRQTYSKLGAKSKMDAVVEAKRRGLL